MRDFLIYPYLQGPANVGRDGRLELGSDQAKVSQGPEGRGGAQVPKLVQAREHQDRQAARPERPRLHGDAGEAAAADV